MSRLEKAVEHLGLGGVAILADEDREGAGSLVLGADIAAPETLRVLTENGRGAFQLVFESRRADRIGLAAPAPGQKSEPPPPASGKNTAQAALAQRQLRAIRAALSERGGASDLAALGIVPGRAALGGVLGHAGPAEAAVDALNLAGRAAIAAFRPIRLSGGVLASSSELDDFAERQGLPVFTVQDVVAYRLARETIVHSAASARLPTAYADVPLEVQAFRSLLDGSEHLAMIHGPLGKDPLVRIHSECLTGDALGSLRCDCGDQLRRSLKLITESPSGGAVVYLRGQEGRGIGLVNKIRAYALQDGGRDTVEANVDLGFPADLRDYGVAVQILRALGIERLRLLSNNPRKAWALERYGIGVSERVSLRIGPNPHNANYLETKRLKLGHDLAGRAMMRPA